MVYDESFFKSMQIGGVIGGIGSHFVFLLVHTGYECWRVDFEQKNVVLSLNSVEELEIHLGGILVLKLKNEARDHTNRYPPDIDRNDTEPQMGGVTFINRIEGAVHSVNGRFGPALYDVYAGMRRLAMFGGSVSFANQNPQAKHDLIMTGIEFTRSKIGGIMSLLKKMGISADTPPPPPPDSNNDDGEEEYGRQRQRRRFACSSCTFISTGNLCTLCCTPN